MNLKDGPPPDSNSARRHEHVAYIHPHVLPIILDG
jgi:hypothetical protein